MKKFVIYTIYFVGFFSQNSCAQTIPAATNTNPAPVISKDSFQLEKTIPGQFTAMDIDITNNIYLITAGNQLKKYNSNADSIAVFNDVKKYGNPSQVDVSNPLKILLYYKNFSTVVMLDRLLSLRNSINFRQQQIFSVKAIATSYDNNIWLFDEQDFKLKKINEDGKLLQESTDWRMLMNEVPLPQTIIDHNNFVYIYDEEKGFYIFDYYGTFKNNLPFTGWKNISVSHGRISGVKENKLHIYILQSLSERIYTLPSLFKNYISVKAVNGKLYLLKNDGLEIYSIL
ncbi:MAG TPA: hypothetical protein PK504_08190 [Ferruginibacter sp.]|nr:hypothetical protein [Ferruginibacter sp.]HRE64234.1 hypothetical protein [Ferruginibacter sp.]